MSDLPLSSRKRAKIPAASTRSKILDAAERLFGEQSYDTVSLRDITQEAQVTLALASYHFGTKENLLKEIVARRAIPLSEARQNALANLSNPSVQTILDAFMRPLFEKMRDGDEGWRCYLLILAQIGRSNRWLDLLREYFDPTAALFVDSLQTSLPQIERSLLLRGFSMALVSMLQTLAKNRRLDALSGNSVSSDDLEEAYLVLIKFCSAGLLGLSEDTANGQPPL